MATHDARQPVREMATGTDYLALDDAGLLAVCELDTYRASGPGGQKRNKTASAVRLRMPQVGLIVVGTESRSQHQNRARALRRLRRAIALELRRPIDPDRYQPGPVLRSCLTAKSQLQVGQRDHRYDQAVGEVLDVLAACRMRLSEAAALIGITTANLSSFLRREAKLLARVNSLRREAGMKPIR
jgi:hypothetical protein